MKDFVREYIRIAAIVAGAAFFLSLIVGLIAGNPFGTAFIRAFFLGVCFGLIGVGLAFTVKKYLPEVVQQGSEESLQSEPAEKHAVDIVLPEENPQTLSDAEDVSDVEPAEEVEDTVGEGIEATESDTFSEEETQPEAAVSDEAETPAEQAAAPQGAESSEERGGARPRKADRLDDLDTLPDIAGIAVTASPSPSYGNEPAGEIAPTPRHSRPRADASTPEGYLSNEDPESLARAIRTVLKRDDRG